MGMITNRFICPRNNENQWPETEARQSHVGNKTQVFNGEKISLWKIAAVGNVSLSISEHLQTRREPWL